MLLLPHGYEGQGPDHSSARIERYLQLCAENNMTVAYPSTAASYFHLLRRQAYARPRTPLVVFTPKSMLRSKAAASPVEAFTQGGFQPVLADHEGVTKDVTRVLFASGKIVHELDAEREKRGDTSTAVIRVEQLYPIPEQEMRRRRLEVPRRRARLGAGRAAQPGRVAAHGPVAPRGPLRPRRDPAVARRGPQGGGLARPPGSSKKHAAEQAELMERAFGR